jgi:hypothetical protein
MMDYRTCKKFKGICEREGRLWTGIDDPYDTAASQNHAILKLLNPLTKRARLVSKSYPSSKAYRTTLSPSIQQLLFQKAPFLTELQLIRQSLDAQTFNLLSLPRTLRKLSLSGTMVSNVRGSPCFFKVVMNDWILRKPILRIADQDSILIRIF